MTSGPVVSLCLHRENAVGRLLEILGPSDARVAKRQSQFFLRGSFGEDSVKNAFYGMWSSQIISFKRRYSTIWSLIREFEQPRRLRQIKYHS